METQIQYLMDRAEISDIATTYAHAIDHKDWALLRSLFEEKIELDLDIFGEPRIVWTSDFADFCEDTLSVFGATQHISSNHRIDIDGDEAVLQAHLNATHAFTDGQVAVDHHVLRGLYTFRVHRTDLGWRAYALRMAVWFSIGDTSALERTAAGVPEAKDS